MHMMQLNYYYFSRVQMKSVRRKKGRHESTADDLELSSLFYAWLQKCAAALEKRGLEAEVCGKRTFDHSIVL